MTYAEMPFRCTFTAIVLHMDETPIGFTNPEAVITQFAADLMAAHVAEVEETVCPLCGKVLNHKFEHHTPGTIGEVHEECCQSAGLCTIEGE